MNWKTIFNPFEKFDEKILIIAGMISLFGIILLNKWTDSFYSSIYRIVHVEKLDYRTIIAHDLISYVSAIAVLFILGKFLYQKTRLIDIINTVMISQIPLIIILPLEKFTYIKTAGERVLSYQDNPTSSFPVIDFVLMIITIIISVGAMIYSIVLFYNGFKTATNIKKWQHIVLFCAVTFLTVTICQILNN